MWVILITLGSRKIVVYGFRGGDVLQTWCVGVGCVQTRESASDTSEWLNVVIFCDRVL